MAIHFISGKPGGGKSLYGLKLIFEELRFGTRPIVTNLAVLKGALNEYYHAHYGDSDTLKRYGVPRWLLWAFWWLPDWFVNRVFPVSDQVFDTRLKQPLQDDICGRIHLIDDDEMAVFFTKRPDCEINHVTNSEWKQGVRPDFSKVTDSGVLFVLDEVHIAFNSRAWADTGAEVLYYLSQHRKLGDDVICITQSVGNVDKQFRSVAQDFTYLRNLGKEVAGFFRLPLRFVRKTYSQPPSSDLSQPMEIRTFALDAQGLASCYDTAKGVGIHGRGGADKKERKRGFHWAWFVVGVPLILILATNYLPAILVKITNHNIHRELQKQNHPVPAPAHTAVAVLSPALHSHVGPEISTNFEAGTSLVRTNDEITCLGYCHVLNSWLVFLSDGDEFDSAYGEVDYIHRRQVSCLGRIYDIKKRPASTDADQPTQTQVEIPFSTARPINQIQVIPFGNRNRPTQLNSSLMQTETFDAQMGQSDNTGFAR